jgi:hypothetical protein
VTTTDCLYKRLFRTAPAFDAINKAAPSHSLLTSTLTERAVMEPGYAQRRRGCKKSKAHFLLIWRFPVCWAMHARRARYLEEGLGLELGLEGSEVRSLQVAEEWHLPHPLHQ